MSKVGPKTKASKGEQKYKALSITLPPELWEEAIIWKEKDETKSGFVARLIKYAIFVLISDASLRSLGESDE